MDVDLFGETHPYWDSAEANGGISRGRVASKVDEFTAVPLTHCVSVHVQAEWQVWSNAYKSCISSIYWLLGWRWFKLGHVWSMHSRESFWQIVEQTSKRSSRPCFALGLACPNSLFWCGLLFGARMREGEFELCHVVWLQRWRVGLCPFRSAL